MKKITKKLTAMTLCTAFATMQVYANMMYGDTGLGNNIGGAVIDSATGGYVGTDVGNNSATLNFNGDSHVIWDSLNINNGETLNFNAVDGASGLTVLNTVNNGMSNIYGTITSNQGIAKLIISNPNGMLFDGAHFTTAGDLLLTTQALAVNYLNGNLEFSGLNQEALNGIVIKDGENFKSNFKIGGEFNIVAPTIEILGGYIGANKGLNLITKDGHNFLICPNTSSDYTHKAVVLKAVNVDGDVYILTGEDIINIANGGKINGSLKIESNGNVLMNYQSNGEILEVRDDLAVAADGRFNLLRDAKVGKSLKLSNTGGYVEIANTEVNGNAHLTTTSNSAPKSKHFVHVVGNNKIGGDLHIDSAHNIHIGGYDENLQAHLPGNLVVGGDLNAVAHDGSIAITNDVQANTVDLKSGTLNIVTDGKATITANEYKFDAKHYIGGLKDTNYLINTVMEKYTPIEQQVVGDVGYVNIAGGKVTKLHQDGSSYAFLRSNDSMNINNVNAGNVYMTSGKDIVIGDNAKANQIQVGGETRNLTVKLPSRDYTLKYTNIKDSEVITVDGNTEITYDMANGENGWNKGTQTAYNTYLVVQGNIPVDPDPIVPPVDPNPTDPTIDPDKDDAEKIMKNLNRDEVSSAIDRQQIATPVAFAADLDDEIATGVRKNVDGSVTVVRPFVPKSK
ncbi:filamentous hemagglutinin N-terminal domain-containing protein [bacterium]|nr:filamentous hemagglutinin N-terminal domain-containing protein [bacterium]